MKSVSAVIMQIRDTLGPRGLKKRKAFVSLNQSCKSKEMKRIEKRQSVLENYVSRLGFDVSSHLYSVYCSAPQSLSFCSCCYTDSFVQELNTDISTLSLHSKCA